MKTFTQFLGEADENLQSLFTKRKQLNREIAILQQSGAQVSNAMKKESQQLKKKIQALQAKKDHDSELTG